MRVHHTATERRRLVAIDGMDVVGFLVLGAFSNACGGVIIGTITGMYCSAVQGARWPDGQAAARRRACFKAFAGAQLLNQAALLAPTVALFAVVARRPGFLPYGWVALAALILPRLALAADALRCRRTLDRLPWRFNTAFVDDGTNRGQ